VGVVLISGGCGVFVSGKNWWWREWGNRKFSL